MAIALISEHKNKPVMQMRTDYCDSVWSDPASLVKNAKVTLKGVEFDTFVATGQSGSLALSLFARAFRKNIFVVRKDADHESSHAALKWIGQMGQRWVFLDDFISSGSTKRSVIAGVQEAIDYIRNTGNGEFTTKFVGSYEYEHDRWTPNGFWDKADNWVNSPTVMTPTPREEPKPEPTYGGLTLPPLPSNAKIESAIKAQIGTYVDAMAAAPSAPQAFMMTPEGAKPLPIPDSAGCGVPGCDLCLGVTQPYGQEVF
jgi:hypothetical protein